MNRRNLLGATAICLASAPTLACKRGTYPSVEQAAAESDLVLQVHITRIVAGPLEKSTIGDAGPRPARKVEFRIDRVLKGVVNESTKPFFLLPPLIVWNVRAEPPPEILFCQELDPEPESVWLIYRSSWRELRIPPDSHNADQHHRWWKQRTSSP